MRQFFSPLLIVAVAALSLVPAGVAASTCEPLALTGQTQLNLGNGRIEGVFTGTLGGDPISIFASTTIVDQKQRGAVAFLTTSHVFTVLGGEHDGAQMTTLDNARLIPTPTEGVFRAVSNVDIVSGASGFLTAVGTIDFRGGITATWTQIHGQVCGL